MESLFHAAPALALQIYNHALRTVGRIAREGWRPAFCWAGVLVLGFTYIVAPIRGIAVDTAAANMVLTLLTGAFAVRGVEKHLERGSLMPGGGLVNPSAFEPST